MAHVLKKIILSLLTFVVSSSDGLKDVILQGPYYLRRGEDVFLTCQYDIERDQLYAVKWYRGPEEFYRFVPKEVPPQKVFFLRDHPIHIDVQHSNSRQILVKNVTFSLSGLYKCVVSAETTFQTLSDERSIWVLAIGYEPPRLQLDKIGYHPGDKVKANCSIGKTFPSPNITWFLNDKEMLHLKPNLISIPDERDPPIVTTISQITFTLPESYLPSKLSCRGLMMDVYEESSIKKIQPVPRNYTFLGGESGKARSSKSAPSNRVHSVVNKVNSFGLNKSQILHISFRMNCWTILQYLIYFITPLLLLLRMNAN